MHGHACLHVCMYACVDVCGYVCMCVRVYVAVLAHVSACGGQRLISIRLLHLIFSPKEWRKFCLKPSNSIDGKFLVKTDGSHSTEGTQGGIFIL